MSDKLQETVGTWGEQTFPKATLRSIVTHLEEEVGELKEAIEAESNVMEEAADIYLMLLHIAHKMNSSLDESAKVKFAICKERKWSEPDKDGVSRHI